MEQRTLFERVSSITSLFTISWVIYTFVQQYKLSQKVTLIQNSQSQNDLSFRIMSREIKQLEYRLTFDNSKNTWLDVKVIWWTIMGSNIVNATTWWQVTIHWNLTQK